MLQPAGEKKALNFFTLLNIDFHNTALYIKPFRFITPHKTILHNSALH